MLLIQLLKRDAHASLRSRLLKKHAADSRVVALNQSESPDVRRRFLLAVKSTFSRRQTGWRPTDKNTQEEVKRLKSSPHFLRLLLDERLGDGLLPLLRLGERGAALTYLGGE